MPSLLGDHTSHLRRWLCRSAGGSLPNHSEATWLGLTYRALLVANLGHGLPAYLKTPPVPGSTHPGGPVLPQGQAVPCSGFPASCVCDNIFPS